MRNKTKNPVSVMQTVSSLCFSQMIQQRHIDPYLSLYCFFICYRFILFYNVLWEFIFLHFLLTFSYFDFVLLQLLGINCFSVFIWNSSQCRFEWMLSPCSVLKDEALNKKNENLNIKHIKEGKHFISELETTWNISLLWISWKIFKE